MRKLNKQDSIFIGKIILFIVVTFILYDFIWGRFIIEKCQPIYGGLPGGSGYLCYGYTNFFYESSIYFYLLFLWVTIITSIRRRYQFPHKYVFIGGTVVLLLFIVYIYMETPIHPYIPLRIGH